MFVLRVVKGFERHGGLEVVDVMVFEHHGGLELNELRGAEDLEGRMDFVSLFINRGDLEEASELGEEGIPTEVTVSILDYNLERLRARKICGDVARTFESIDSSFTMAASAWTRPTTFSSASLATLKFYPTIIYDG